MSRILKDPEERKLEILNAAQKLFLEKGFQETSVSEIVKAVGVAQGTFYYYFKTKEDIIDGIINRYIDEIIEAVTPILEDKALEPLKKIERMTYAELEVNFRNVRNLHRIRHIDIHDRIFSGLVNRLSPCYVRAVEEGIAKGIFQTVYPLEMMHIVLISSHFLFDQGLFNWPETEFARIAKAISSAMEATLKAEEGSFDFYAEAMMKIIELRK
jgi:AcrR family transcriptional regulator